MKQIKKIIVALVSLSLVSNCGYAINSNNDSSKNAQSPSAMDPETKKMYEKAMQHINKRGRYDSSASVDASHSSPNPNNYNTQATSKSGGQYDSAKADGSKQSGALGSDKVVLNFENADVQSVIKAVSQLSGKNFVIDPKVKGTINIVSERPISKSDSYKVLESALRMLGFATVEADGVIKVLTEADAKAYGMQTSAEGAKIYKAKSSNPGDQVITKVFVLPRGSAVTLANTLRPLIAPNNSILAYPNSNALVITDYASNMKRIAKVVDDLITPAGVIKPIIITFEHAIAADVAQVLQSFLQGGSTSGGGYSSGSSGYSSGSYSSGGGGYSGGAGGGSDAPAVSVTVNPQNNSIILYSTSKDRIPEAKEKMQELEHLAHKMDHATGKNNSSMHVVYLKNADAGHIADVLRVVATSQENPDLTASSAQSKFLNEPSSMFQSGGGSGGMGGGSSAFGGGANGGGAFGGGGNRPGGMTGNMQGNRGGPGQSGQNQQNMPKILIQAEPTTNSLIIQAPDAMYRNLRMIIEMLDVRRAQVLIEAMLVSVNLLNSGAFGIQWLVGGGANNAGAIAVSNYGGAVPGTSQSSQLSSLAGTIIGATQGAAGNQTQGAATGAAGLGNIPGEVFVGLVTGTTTIGGQTVPTLGALADMIASTSSGNVLTRPTMITLDNEEAKIMVGQNVGVPNGSFQNSANSSGNLVTTVTRQDLGTFLQIKPKITQSGSIQLDIYQENSSIQQGGQSQALIQSQGYNFLKQNMRATVLLDDGQIIALGGMTVDTVSVQQNGIPILSTIPGIGWLFSWQGRSHTKSNLVLFLRPVIIRNAEGSRALSNQRYKYVLDQQNLVQAKGNLLLPNMNAVNLNNQVPYDDKIPPQPDNAVKNLPIVDARASTHRAQLQHQQPANGAKAAVTQINAIPYDTQIIQSQNLGTAPAHSTTKAPIVNK